MTVGCNQRFTPQKWDRFRYLISVHSKMVKGIVATSEWTLPEYHYFDLYAGPGLYKNEISSSLFGDYGSPLIAAGCLRNQPHKLFLNDYCKDCIVRLSTALATEHAKASVTCLDVNDFAWRICDEKWRLAEFGGTRKKAMGIVFVDPNGSPDWQAVESIAGVPQYQQLDFLINVNATSIKRCRNSPTCKGRFELLSDSLARLRKRCLYVWAPHRSNAWQFALVFATNWEKFPEFDKSKFWRIDSPDGAKVFDRLNYTHEEMR